MRFNYISSYLAAQSLSVRPDGVALHGAAAQYGALGVDIAFGGAYYGIVNAAELGLRVVPEQADELRRVGAAITEVLRRDHTPAHPTDPDLSFVYGTIIVDLEPRNLARRQGPRRAHPQRDDLRRGRARPVAVRLRHERDPGPAPRSRPNSSAGQEIVNAGITGEHFLGRVESETVLGPYRRSEHVSIAGTAYITGYSTFIVDSRDPLGDGFLLG